MTEITNLNKTTERIESKLDSFIDSADKKYATKEELHELKLINERQEKDISWSKEKILDLSVKITNIAVIIGLGTKAFGIW